MQEVMSDYLYTDLSVVRMYMWKSSPTAQTLQAQIYKQMHRHAQLKRGLFQVGETSNFTRRSDIMKVKALRHVNSQNVHVEVQPYGSDITGTNLQTDALSCTN